MRISNKKPGATGTSQPFNRPAEHAAQIKPFAGQLKTGGSAQRATHPIAPPVYKPQLRQTGVQAKTGAASTKISLSAQSGKRPVAPPVYRPRALPKALQTKISVSYRASQKKGVVQLWHNVNGQEGEFEGNEAYHHLHRVGGNEHYRYANGDRIRFVHNGAANYGNIERAIEACGIDQPNNAGRDECLAYLRELLAATPKPKPVVVVAPKKKDPPPPKPPPKGGGGKGSRLNKLGDAMVAKRSQEIF